MKRTCHQEDQLIINRPEKESESESESEKPRLSLRTENAAEQEHNGDTNQ